MGNYAFTTGTTSKIEVTNLDPGTTVMVDAFRIELITMPEAPTDLILEEWDEQEIDLYWSDNATNEDGYIVERSENGGEFIEIANINYPDQYYYYDMGLQPGINYCYRVYCYNVIGNSGYSNEECYTIATTPAPTLEPTPDPTQKPTPEPTEELTPTPESGEISIKAMYKCRETNIHPTLIKPCFNIINTGDVPVPLVAVTLRYYYSKDELDSEETLNIPYTLINATNLDYVIHDTYFELIITKQDLVLEPGLDTGEIQVEVNKNTWSHYLQENDYSFDPEKIEYEDWQRVTLYYNGALVWGTEPVELAGITCSIEFPQNSGYTDHWLPNTGEALSFSSINIMGYNDLDQDVSLQFPYLYITILPPHDPNWETNDADNSNIHRNKGNCEYDLFVVYSDESEELLATFYKDNTVSEQYFQVKYNDICFYDVPGTPLHGMAILENGYSLQTRIEGENLGNLYFRNTNRALGKESEDFRLRIRTDDDRIIRPGDDMQLRFGVSGFPVLDTSVKVGDFVAVYDKKLLWRANLYIDETKIADTGADSGDEDWNDANPWHQPDESKPNYNDWDLNGDGGQCVIQPWTRPYDPDSEYHSYGVRMEYASVAYSEVGRDSPLDFNADLFDQRDSIRHYLNMPNYNLTLAPTINDWRTYIDHTKKYNGIDVDTNIYQPYRPVFSSLVLHINNGDQFYDQNWDLTYQQAAGYTAGTNCNGLTLQAAAYNGNNYMYTDVNIGPRLDWGQNYGGAYPRGDYVWIMWDEDNPNEYTGMNNLIVPGDMVDMHGHAGVVCKVVFNENNREIVMNRCLILEATAPRLEYKIFKNRDIQYHTDSFDNFKIVRLTIREEQ